MQYLGGKARGAKQIAELVNLGRERERESSGIRFVEAYP